MLLAGGEQDQGCLPPVVMKIPSSGLLPGLAIPLLPGRFLRDAPPEVHACCLTWFIKLFVLLSLQLSNA